LAAIAALAQITVGGGGGAPVGIPPGSTIWYGTTAPLNTVGANGDYYLNTNTYCVYGPKAMSVWPSTCTTSVSQFGYIAESLGNKGAAGGYAPLDVNALLPAANMPAIAAINGTTVPTNRASDQTVVTTAAAVGAWTALPSCPDTGGSHLNYSLVTHGFLCGNTGGTAGSVTFGGVGSGNNANALLVSGTLGYTGGGLVNANQLGGVSLSSLPTGLVKVTTGTGAPSVAAAADVTATLGFTPENPANKGAAGGYAPLNGSGLLPANYLPGLSTIAGTLAGSQMPVLTGDIGNTGLATTVVRLQNRALAGTAPTDGQVLTWSAAGSTWQPVTPTAAAGGLVNPGGAPAANTVLVADGANGDRWSTDTVLFTDGTLSTYHDPTATGHNVFFGNGAGNRTMSPAGGSAGLASFNVGIGYQALAGTTTGNQNVGIGELALAANTTGQQNVAMGNLSMVANTTGSYNTAVGENALGNNTTGYDNYAFGLRALYQNTTGYNNAAFGIDSVGINTTGYRNSGFGTDSCAWNVTGYENSCMGMNTLWSLTTGYDNTGTGFNAMFGATSGHYLTGLGAYADMYYPNTSAGVTLTPTSATANLSVGWYWYKVSFVLNGQETALSNNSYLGVLTDSAHKEVTITGIPTFSGPFTASARRLYRTVVCPTTLCTVITANQAPRQWFYVGTINDNTTTAYVDTTADTSLGPQESSTPSKSIALGAYATVYGSYQMVVGSDASPVQQIWLGNGMVTGAAPSGVLVSSSGASGTNVAGQDYIMAGGPGTGTANGGNVIFATVPAAASGSTWNSLVNRWKVDSATGNLVSLSTGGIAGVTGTVDFSGGAHTLPAKTGIGASKPSTCTIGEQYFATDAAPGQNLFGCTAANTWTLQGGGGSGGAVSSIFGRTGAITASAGDYNLSQIATGSLSATGGTIYNAAGTGNTQVVIQNSSSQAANGAGSVIWKNNAGSSMAFINWDGGYAEGDGTNYKISLDTSTATLSSDSVVVWHSSNNAFSGVADTGLAREAAGGTLKVTNGGGGYGTLDAGGLEINGAPLAKVAASGSYTDLVNQPSLAGDVTGGVGANTVARLQNRALAGTAPSDGQALIWNAASSQWQPGTITSGGGGAINSVFGRTGTITAQAGDYTFAQIGGTLPDAALPGDAVTTGALGNATLTADLVSLTTTGAITSGGALTATGNVYANSGSSAPGCLHLSDANGVHDTGICAAGSGFNGQFNLWAGAGAAGQVATTDGSLNLLWSNLSGIAGTLAAAQMPALTGDVGNTGLATTVTGLQGRPVSSTGATDQQYLGWSASAGKWQPISLPSSTVTSVFGRTGAVAAAANDYTLSQIATGTLSATSGTIYNPAGAGNTQIVMRNSTSQAGNGAGSVLWLNNAGNTMSFINWDGGYAEGDGTNYKISVDTSTETLSSDSVIVWHGVNNAFSGVPDTGLARETAGGILKVTNGASGYGVLDAGGLEINGSALAKVATSGSYTDLTGQPALAGDVTGGIGANTVAKIQNRAIASTAPSDGQSLVWSAASSQWQPATISSGGGGVSSVFGRNGAVLAQAGDYTAAQVTNALSSTQTYASPAWLTAVTFGGTTLNSAGGTIYNNAASGNTQIVIKNSSSQAANGAGSILWQNNAGSNIAFINWDGGYATGDGTNYKISLDTETVGLSSDALIVWHNVNSVFAGTGDIGLQRPSAGVLRVTAGASGYGAIDSGGYSASGTPGVTSTTCTQWTNGLCTHN
jgi:hypothetical protein